MKPSPDTDIETLSANLRSGPDGTNAQDMKLVVPAIGELSGAGTISPSNNLDFKMSAIVHTSGLLAAIGDRPIPFTVGGTSSDPVFRPDLKAVAKEELKSIVGSGDVSKAATGILNRWLGGKKKE